MEQRVWLKDRTVRSLERELGTIIPNQCGDCAFPQSVLARTLMSYRMGSIKRRDAANSMSEVLGAIDACAGRVKNPDYPSLGERCGIVPVANSVELVSHHEPAPNQLPEDEAYA